MQVLIAQVINGLSLGSIYVLLVTGFNLLLLVAMIIHFSYPQVVVFSMYITWVVLRATGNNLPQDMLRFHCEEWSRGELEAIRVSR